jgi:hypothetical protein
MNRGRVNFISFCITLAVILTASSGAGAQIVTAQEFSGRATGINSTITTNGSPSTASTGDTCPLPARGGTSTATTSGVLIPGVLGSGTIVSSTSGSGITSQSSSNVSDFILRAGGWTFRATNVSSSSQCNCCDIANPACSAQSSVTGLTVTDPTGANVPVTVTGQPGQVVTLPGGAGTITFSERTSGPGTITVNAMRINVTVGGTNYNVVVASSHSDIVCPGIGPTPAQVNISGRTLDVEGRSISNVAVTVVRAQDGEVVGSAGSGLTGEFTVKGITVGQTYIVQATHRSYVFAPRAITLQDETNGFDLTGTRR